MPEPQQTVPGSVPEPSQTEEMIGKLGGDVDMNDEVSMLNRIQQLADDKAQGSPKGNQNAEPAPTPASTNAQQPPTSPKDESKLPEGVAMLEQVEDDIPPEKFHEELSKAIGDDGKTRKELVDLVKSHRGRISELTGMAEVKGAKHISQLPPEHPLLKAIELESQEQGAGMKFLSQYDATEDGLQEFYKQNYDRLGKFPWEDLDEAEQKKIQDEYIAHVDGTRVAFEKSITGKLKETEALRNSELDKVVESFNSQVQPQRDAIMKENFDYQKTKYGVIETALGKFSIPETKVDQAIKLLQSPQRLATALFADETGAKLRPDALHNLLEIMHLQAINKIALATYSANLEKATQNGKSEMIDRLSPDVAQPGGGNTASQPGEPPAGAIIPEIWEMS